LLFLTIGAAAALAVAPPKLAGDSDSASAYSRAEQFLPENAARMVLNNDIQATWLGSTDLLWYKDSSETGWSFMVADPHAGRRQQAFDHAAMAEALERALHTEVKATTLPISSIDFPSGLGGPVRVKIGAKALDCTMETRSCVEPAPDKPLPDRSYSPNGKFALFTRDHNLWLQDLTSGNETPLTTDGSELKAYSAGAGIGAPVFRERRNIVRGPLGLFSPDGNRFLTFQLDESRSPTTTLIEHAPAQRAQRPRAHSYPASYVGDPPATADLYIFDLLNGTKAKVRHGPTSLGLVSPVALAEAKWSADSRFFYFTDYADLYRTRSLFRGDAATGQTNILISDRASTNQYSFVHPNWVLLANGDI